MCNPRAPFTQKNVCFHNDTVPIGQYSTYAWYVFSTKKREKMKKEKKKSLGTVCL